MRSLSVRALCPIKLPSKPMSTLAPGHILRGANRDYRIDSIVSGDRTHRSTVFKAGIIPHDNTFQCPHWALIKTASFDDADAIENLQRERHIYSFPDVASSTCFRKLYDTITNDDDDKAYIALEWLDTTLQELEYGPNMRTYAIIGASLSATLNSCVVMEDLNLVNTDYKPANILLSGVETGHITSKVGDLGLVFPSGDRIKAQPYSMRAPEVFLGQACTGPSQIWAVAATLLCWIRPSILGAWGSPHPLINDAWSMAKIKRLFPDWIIPTSDEVEGHSLKAAVKAARRMSEEEDAIQDIAPFEEEMQKAEMLPQLKDLLSLMLVVDPKQRPSASSILAASEFKVFERFALHN